MKAPEFSFFRVNCELGWIVLSLLRGICICCSFLYRITVSSKYVIWCCFGFCKICVLYSFLSVSSSIGDPYLNLVNACRNCLPTGKRYFVDSVTILQRFLSSNNHPKLLWESNTDSIVTQSNRHIETTYNSNNNNTVCPRK